MCGSFSTLKFSYLLIAVAAFPSLHKISISPADRYHKQEELCHVIAHATICIPNRIVQMIYTTNRISIGCQLLITTGHGRTGCGVRGCGGGGDDVTE